MPLHRPTRRAIVAPLAAIVLGVLLVGCSGPPPPTGVTVTPGDRQLTVAFAPQVIDPHPAGMARSEQFRVVLRSDDAFVALRNAPSSPVTIGGLENGRSYRVEVFALSHDEKWESTPSIAHGTPRTTPGSPRSVSASARVGAIEVGFAAPASNGGSPVTGYRAIASDGTNPPISVSGTSSPLTISGVLPGTAYDVTVVAINAAGTGATSPVSRVTAVGAPGAPRNVQATPGDTSVSISFDPPESDGGSAIVGYTVVHGVDDETLTFLPVSGSTSPITVTGLSNGVEYHFAVYAQNAVGAGLMSSTVDATPSS